ncbi:cation transporter [Siccirubricoccus deserti]|uniref:Cation:proton antiporter n=1 Tax=Siccirubricoccus deserti TaxID=2013562 RepID=A0A9X0UGT9_9PROT|nr:cation:proton antiporter [Siccirubricoccus deserti]MBC4019303.1 cation:proton antiporter [Siccirubricoccus deserti]GGC73252.1 cation transporter [Siccirubricoccus deserti]
MDPYILLLTGTGVLVLLVAWLPMALRELPLSLPMFCVAFGYVAFSLSTGDTPNPLRYPNVAERLTETVVIVALTGAGLKLDRPFHWGNWALTWRLLIVAMPLSILGIALIGHALLGLGVAAAVLLGAALAPTDPVLAADVQVGPPHSGEEDEVRFTLTAEAGLNDGLSFPFVNLAVALALVGTAPADWLEDWLARDVVWKLSIGLALGWAIGWGLGWLTFHMPNRARLSRTGDGFVALGATFLTYGATELAHGYGFLAVFIAALAMRAAERHHNYHDRLHDFAEQTERLLMMVLLVLFGGALAGGLLAPLRWWDVAGVLLFLFVVRPAAGLVSLLGTTRPLAERAAISFFGIRGLGSFYYLAYALNAAPFQGAEGLWAVLGLTVLVSITLHGVTVTPAMRWLDRRRRRQGVLPLEA